MKIVKIKLNNNLLLKTLQHFIFITASIIVVGIITNTNIIYFVYFFIFLLITTYIYNIINLKFLTKKFRYLLRNLPQDCFLEINLIRTKIEVKPILNTNHNIIKCLDTEKNFTHEYYDFFRFFLRHYDESQAIGYIIKIYKKDNRIFLNYHRTSSEIIKRQKIY